LSTTPYGAPATTQVAFTKAGTSSPVFWSDAALWTTPELEAAGFAYYVIVNELVTRR
jgi:hypothetical protein